MSMKNSSDAIGNRSGDRLVCSAVPQPLRHHVPPIKIIMKENTVFILRVESMRIDSGNYNTFGCRPKFPNRPLGPSSLLL
jgi:hypothetical protein